MNVINPGIFLLLSALLTVLLSVLAWKHRDTPSGKTFSLLMAAASVWAFFYGLELFAESVQTMWLFLVFSYIGISFVSVVWLVFVARYTELDYWLNRRTIVMLLAVPVITLLAVASNPLHFRFYTSISQESTTLFSYLALTPGPLWYLSVIVSHCYFFSGLALLVYQYFRVDKQYQSLLFIFILAGLIPYVFNVLYILELRPYGFLDMTPLAFLIMGTLLAYGAIRYHLFEITPLAYDLLFNHLYDPVFVFDNQRRLVHQNPHGLKLLQTLPNETDNPEGAYPHTPENLHPDPDNQPLIELNEHYYYKQSRIITNKREIRLGALVQLYDVTKSKKSELALRKNEQRLQKLNNTKNLLFSIIAHDLKSPFTTILGFSELLLEDLQRKQYNEAEAFARLIMQSSNKTVTLLEQLTDWARAQSETLTFTTESISLTQIFREISGFFSEAAKHKSIRIVHEQTDSLTVMADRNMLTFVLRNLLDNAIKFSHTGGTVTMSAHINNTEIVLSVMDEGVGIPPDLLTGLFDIDKRHSREGTLGESGSGFGLLTCQEFVRKHEGRIWAETNSDAGSTFYVALPALPNEPQVSGSTSTGTSR